MESDPRWAGHSGVRLHSGLDTAESDSMGGWTQRSQTTQWARDSGVRLHGESDSRVRLETAKPDSPVTVETAESDSPVTVETAESDSRVTLEYVRIHPKIR